MCNFKTLISGLLHLTSLIVLVLLGEGSFAQKYYLFQNYNTSNGLANNNVLSITQGGDGYMYFGTDVGLTRFDGSRFDNNVIPVISQNSAFVECVDIDDKGNLLVASFMQGFFIQQPDKSFKQYLIEKQQIGKNVIKDLCAGKSGKILLSSGISIYLFDKDSIKRILYDKSNSATVTTFTFDKKENIWFGGYKGLAVIYAGDTSYTPHYLPEMDGKYLERILFDKSGNLLVGTIKGFYKLIFNVPGDYRKGCKVSSPIPDLENSAINSLYIDKQNSLWISTPTLGVFKINNDTVTENITINNGLPSIDVMRTFQDSEGNFWFGTSSAGLVKLVDFNKYSFSYDGKLLKNVSDIAIDEYGRIFLIDVSNFYVIQNNIVHKIEAPEIILKRGGLRDFMIDGNTLWAVNHNGLYSAEINEKIPDLKNMRTRADFIKKDISRFRYMNLDKNGVWIASDKGIYLFRDNRFINFKIKDEKVSRIRPVKIISDQFGYNWFGDFSYGLYRMKLVETGKNEFILDSIKAYKSVKPDSAFVTAWAQDMIIDHQGYMWFSSLNTGVYRLKIDKSGVIGHELFSIKNGLSSNQVSKLFEDGQHRIWFSTIEGADCYDPATGKFLHYNKKNSLGNQVKGILANKSKVFLEYSEGILVIDDINKEYTTGIPPKPIITRISINGIIDSLALSSNQPLKLEYNQNNITFEYGAITFKYQNELQYQYMIEGLNYNWSSFTENRNISFSNLAPGSYCFKVRSKNTEGLISNEFASFAFKISPPFYKTWWFILLISISIISLIYAAYKYRIKQLLKVERLRTRIASDLHDDIGSTLSSISILSEILSNQLDNNPKSSTMISQIGTNARNMLESMDDIIWAVNPSNDKFQNLGLRIREYAIPLFESKNIKFNFHIDNALAMVQLPMDIRRNLYLIAKESINNLVKYSECKLAKVEFLESGNSLLMTISDDGKGFDAQSPTSRNGLKNIRRRAEQIKATIDISSTPGKGSIVKLTVKII